MTKQIYLDRIEKGIKIIRTYDVMINQQQNYKTLPHYMKMFGDFCFNYLRYKTIETGPYVNHLENISEILALGKEHQIEVPAIISEHLELIQKCKDTQYTDVAECMKEMPVTNAIIEEIMADINE